jgi:NADH dehydrogenase
VVRQLRRQGCNVRALVRRPDSKSTRALVSEFGVEPTAGDILDPASLDRGLAGADALVHLVGIISEAGASTFESLHTQATQNAVAAARKAGIGRMVHMSALGTRPGAAARYHQTKWAAEESVRQSGLDYTIFRPSLIYGPRDHFVNLFATIARLSPVVPVLATGAVLFQPVAVECVARAFAQALDEPKASGRAFDLCGPERLTLEQIIDGIIRALGRRRLKCSIPLELARLQATALEFVFPKLLGKAPPLNRDQLLMLREDNTGDPKPADELFGLSHPSFQEGIQRYLVR